MTAAETIAAMKKWGVQYREFSGWATRKRPGDFTDVRGIIIHHTGSDAQSDAYLKWIFTEGRPAEGIPAPLCNVSTDMDGDLWIGAIGRANHAGRGSGAVLAKVTAESYPGYASELKPGEDNTDGNAHFYGNEVRYDGGQPMTAQQYASAVRWAAAVCDHHRWSALSVIGHREWSSRKPDPGNCAMNKFRAAVAALLKAGPPQKPAPAPTPVSPEDDMTTPSDIVGTNSDGSAMTMGQLASRLNFVYQSIVEGGKVDSALDNITATVNRIEDDTDDGTVTP
jgi:hypothetical protein